MSIAAPSNQVQPIIIQENSIILKVFTSIPVIGNIFGYFVDKSLAQNIDGTPKTNTPKLVALIDVKNQYLAITAVRNLLFTALVVCEIAFGLINVASGAILLGLFIVSAGRNISIINHNNQVVKELQKTGFRPEMQIL